MMGQGFGYGGFGMLGGGSMMMILLIAIVGFVVYLALKKQSSGDQSSYPAQHSAHSEALSIAKSRLASGEITVEEFEGIKKNLF